MGERKKTIIADNRASSPRSVSLHRVGLRPAPSSPLPSKRRGGRQGTGGISAAMKDRMQELRHVSWCLIVAATCSEGFGLPESPRKAKHSSVFAAGATVVVSERRSHFVRYQRRQRSVRVSRHQILPLINDRTSVIPAKTLLFSLAAREITLILVFATPSAFCRTGPTSRLRV